nr:izumo sperm-egg fusion protein 2 isoform X3 [Aotus nancymaae]
MPLALTLLLLSGLGAPGGWGCLQCEPSVLEALSHLRSALIPSRFQLEQLQARAEAVLLGMEGPFFRDYALNVFVGKVERNQLDPVASFVKNQTQDLMGNSLKDEPLLEELVTLRANAIQELKKVLRSYELKACNPAWPCSTRGTANTRGTKLCWAPSFLCLWLSFSSWSSWSRLVHTGKTENSCCSRTVVWGL